MMMMSLMLAFRDTFDTDSFFLPIFRIVKTAWRAKGPRERCALIHFHIHIHIYIMGECEWVSGRGERVSQRARVDAHLAYMY